MDINAKTIRQIAEEWSTLANGGSIAMPTKVSWQATERDVDAAKAAVLEQLYSTQILNQGVPMRLNDQWTLAPIVAPSSTQPSFLELQFCYYTYDFYPTVSLNSQTDGFLSLSGVTQVGSAAQYINAFKLSGFEQWRNIAKRGISAVNNLYWWYQDGQINTNTLISAIKVRFIPASPYQVKTYDVTTKTYSYMLNPDTSPYPISGEILEKMRDWWFKSKGIPLGSAIKDTTDNGNINANQAVR